MMKSAFIVALTSLSPPGDRFSSVASDAGAGLFARRRSSDVTLRRAQDLIHQAADETVSVEIDVEEPSPFKQPFSMSMPLMSGAEEEILSFTGGSDWSSQELQEAVATTARNQRASGLLSAFAASIKDYEHYRELIPVSPEDFKKPIDAVKQVAGAVIR